jgi:hypothetical protein
MEIAERLPGAVADDEQASLASSIVQGGEARVEHEAMIARRVSSRPRSTARELIEWR